MTKKEAMERFQQGQHLMVVEYRSGVAQAVEYRDKTTGRPARFCKASHNVEAGTLAFAVTERLSEDAKTNEWKPPFKKGQMCVLEVESFARQNGNVSASGKLEILSD